jgi:hypothetical protein
MRSGVFVVMKIQFTFWVMAPHVSFSVLKMTVSGSSETVVTTFMSPGKGGQARNVPPPFNF